MRGRVVYNGPEGVVSGVPTGPRMGPCLYSTPRTGEGPCIVHAHGGPVATVAIGAAGSG